MQGPGAGRLPTASAVVGDLINLASTLNMPEFARYFKPQISSEMRDVFPIEETISSYYVRLETHDTPGVIGNLGHAFGEHGVSLHSVTQRGVSDEGSATIVLLTHRVRERQLQDALARDCSAAYDKEAWHSVTRARLIMQDTKPHIVIVGGGFGGLTAAQTLRRAPVRITLIDRTNHHLFQPLLYQVAIAGLSPADIAAPIRSILRRQKNVNVVLGEVTGIDLDRKVVKTRDCDFTYDFLVLSSGGRTSYFGHEEWRRTCSRIERPGRCCRDSESRPACV